MKRGWCRPALLLSPFLCRWFCVWCSFILESPVPSSSSFWVPEEEREWKNLSESLARVLFTSFLYCKDEKEATARTDSVREEGKRVHCLYSFRSKREAEIEVLSDFVSLSLLLLLLLLCISTCFSYTSSSSLLSLESCTLFPAVADVVVVLEGKASPLLWKNSLQENHPLSVSSLRHHNHGATGFLLIFINHSFFQWWQTGCCCCSRWSCKLQCTTHIKPGLWKLTVILPKTKTVTRRKIQSYHEDPEGRRIFLCWKFQVSLLG